MRERLADPLLRALKSRRVVIALSALVVGLLVMAVPELAEVRGELLTLVASLALAVIGGYSLRDATRIARERNGNGNSNGASPKELRRLVKELLIELIDEVDQERREVPVQIVEENVNV